MPNDCPHCDRSLPNASALDDHVERAHPDEEAGSGGSGLAVVVGLAVLAAAVVGLVVLAGGGGSSERFDVEQASHTGDPDAPVQFAAFESPACTSCQVFHTDAGGEPAYDRILAEYVETGDVVYMESFARAGYGWDRVGANAQRCAWHLDCRTLSAYLSPPSGGRKLAAKTKVHTNRRFVFSTDRPVTDRWIRPDRGSGRSRGSALTGKGSSRHARRDRGSPAASASVRTAEPFGQIGAADRLRRENSATGARRRFEVDGDDACGSGDRVPVGVGLLRAALRAAA